MGALKAEINRHVQASSPGQLSNVPNYPHAPDSEWLCQDFEVDRIPSNSLERIHGYLTPQETGDYVFYLASDDQGYLFLSNDGDSANKKLIASESQWVLFRQWAANKKRPDLECVSVSQHLIEGRRYYIEALAFNDGGDGHVGVAWRKAGQPAPAYRDPPISGEYLSVEVEPSQ